MKSNYFIQRLILFFKGMLMGAVDLVPGVSGGTIAFIVGIYEEFLATIDKLSLSFFKVWRKEGFVNAWKTYNLGFLTILLSGVGLSIVSLAKVITYLIASYPILVWAFFFGLIIASVIYIVRQMKPWSLLDWIGCLVTVGFAYWLTIIKPLGGSDSLWFFFFAGFLGIIALILPGISGAFILLLIGAYTPVLTTLTASLDALSQWNVSVLMSEGLKLVMFLVGMLVGIKIFSRVLTYLFEHFKNITFAIMTGFMVGSLNKIWPWKEVLEYRMNSKGEQEPFLEESILPGRYQEIYNVDPQILGATILMVVGFALILLVDVAAKKKEKRQQLAMQESLK